MTVCIFACVLHITVLLSSTTYTLTVSPSRSGHTVSLVTAYLLVNKLPHNYLTRCVNLSKCHAYIIAGAIMFDLQIASVCAVGGWVVCLAVGVYCECVRQMAHPLHLHVPPYTLPRILCLSQQPVTFQHRERSWGR